MTALAARLVEITLHIDRSAIRSETVVSPFVSGRAINAVRVADKVVVRPDPTPTEARTPRPETLGTLSSRGVVASTALAAPPGDARRARPAEKRRLLVYQAHAAAGLHRTV